MLLKINNKMLSNYKIKKILGRGAFSIVKLAIDIKTGEKIAIKILEKNKIKTTRDFKRIEREIGMDKIMNHLNVAKIFEIKEDEEKYYIMMEYCEKGELFNLILEKHKLSEEDSAYYYFQIINGLEYIHSNNIIHRDLKPENLLLTKNDILKIIDFGLSNYNASDNLLSTPCGSPCYASPEMVSGKKYNGITSDVWSTGIILYAMIYGYLPFENINNDNYLLFRKISECKVDYPRTSCLYALDLLKKILIANPIKRITINEIKKHKFYLKGKDIFNQRHKDLNLYNNIELKQSINYHTIYENNSPKKKYYINNKINLNENKENIKTNESKEEKKIIKYKKIKRKYNKNIIMRNSEMTIKTSRNTFNKELIDEKNQMSTRKNNYYLSNSSSNKNKRRAYCFNITNITDINNNLNENKNKTIIFRNNFSLEPSLKIESNTNYKSLKYQEETKNESIIDNKKSEKKINNFDKTINYSNKNNRVLNFENYISNQNNTNKNKAYRLDIATPFPIKSYESRNKKRR